MAHVGGQIFELLVEDVHQRRRNDVTRLWVRRGAGGGGRLRRSIRRPGIDSHWASLVLTYRPISWAFEWARRFAWQPVRKLFQPAPPEALLIAES